MRRSIIYVVFTISCLAANAQVLFEVSGNGVKEKSYILASNHLMPSGILTAIPGVFRAYNHSECVLGEIVIDEQAATRAMMLHGMAEKSIDELLEFDDQMMVDSMLRKDLGIGLQAVMMLKPGIITTLWIGAVAQSLYPRKDEDEAMDSYFQQMAIIDGKEVNGLETMDDQMDLMLKGTEDAQARELVDVMSSGRERLRIDVEALTKMFAEGDLDGIAAIEEREYTEAARLELIEGRNEKWMTKIVEMMREKRCLVVISAMHLTGNTGLLRALRAKGFFVKAVNE